MPDGKRQWMPADQWAVRENLREFIDHLTQMGYTVPHGHEEDPDLIDPGGSAVETWREDHPYDETTAKRQVDRTKSVRANRDEAKVQALLDELIETAQDDSKNIMPVTIQLVKEGATMGDIVEKLKTIWGVYRETPVF